MTLPGPDSDGQEIRQPTQQRANRRYPRSLVIDYDEAICQLSVDELLQKKMFIYILKIGIKFRIIPKTEFQSDRFLLIYLNNVYLSVGRPIIKRTF